ncbi:hypothetical protein AB0F43_11760 [Kribbella sp. NPDC023972]|uniref:hypothetical protein n=1 Tax=Kribbella sp. NPDC023972 TaxID=3154795 RepID=UPI00340D7DFB
MAEAEEIFEQTLQEVRKLINNLKLLREAVRQRKRARAAMEFMRDARRQNPALDQLLNDKPDRAEQWGRHEREVRQLEEESARLEAENAERRAELGRMREQLDRQQGELDDRNGDGIPDQLRDPRDRDRDGQDDAPQHRDEVAADNARAVDGDQDGRLDTVERDQEQAEQSQADEEQDEQSQAEEEQQARAEQDQDAEAQRQEERDREERREGERDDRGVDPAAPVAAAGTAAVVADELDDREEQAELGDRGEQAELNDREEQAELGDREEQPGLDQQRSEQELGNADGTGREGTPGADVDRQQVQDQGQQPQQVQDQGQQPQQVQDQGQQPQQVQDQGQQPQQVQDQGQQPQQVQGGRQPELGQEPEQVRDGQQPELGERPQQTQDGPGPQQAQEGQDHRDVMADDGSIRNATFTVRGPDQEQSEHTQSQDLQDGPNVRNVRQGEVWIDGERVDQAGQQTGQAGQRAGQAGQRAGQDGPQAGQDGQRAGQRDDRGWRQREQPVQQAINDHRAQHESLQGGQQRSAPPTQKSVEEMRRTQELVNSGQPAAARATGPEAGQASRDGARGGLTPAAAHKESVGRGAGGRTDGPGRERT